MTNLLTILENRRFWIPVCAVFLIVYLSVAIRFTIYPGYTDHVESLIASVSFLLSRGAPLYPDLNAAQRYTVPYGPVAYLPYMLVLRFLGASVLSLKLLILAAHVCLLALLWRCFRKVLDPARATLVTVAIAALLLCFLSLFQVRGDILLLFFVVFGLHAALRLAGWPSTLLLALACGLSLDIKFTALFYFLPVYVLFGRERGRRAVWSSIPATAACALAPFLLPPISLRNYLKWLQIFSREPLLGAELWRELQLLAILLAPFALLLWQMLRQSPDIAVAYLRTNRFFLLTLCGALLAVGVAAAKVGAGPHHFIPFFPLIGYACAEAFEVIVILRAPVSMSRRGKLLPWLWCGLILVVAVKLGISLLSASSPLRRPLTQAQAIDADLHLLMARYRAHKIEMGYGAKSSYPVTNFRPILIFAGHPLTIDEMALDDMQMSGLAIPPTTLSYMRQCRTQIWLLPKNEAPFAVINAYSLENPTLFPNWRVFGDEFRRVFSRNYRKIASSQYFDVFQCTASPVASTRSRAEK